MKYFLAVNTDTLFKTDGEAVWRFDHDRLNWQDTLTPPTLLQNRAADFLELTKREIGAELRKRISTE